MFKVYWDLSDLNPIKEAVVATFFDIYEDVSSVLLAVFPPPSFPSARSYLQFCSKLGLWSVLTQTAQTVGGT